jgi:hypothetical protein
MFDEQISANYKEENPTGSFTDYIKNIIQRELITHLSGWWYGQSPFAGLSTFSPSIQYITEPDASWVISDQDYNGNDDFDTTVDNPFIWLEFRKRFLSLSLTNEDKIFAYGAVTLVPASQNVPRGLRTGLGNYLEFKRTLPTQFTIIFNIIRHSGGTFYFNFYMNEFLISGTNNGLTLWRYNSTTNTFTSTGISFVGFQGVLNNPVFNISISFDFINNKVCFCSEFTVFELISGVSSVRYTVSRNGSMEPVRFTTSNGEVIHPNNSLVDWGNGTFVANNGTVNSFPPITGWSSTEGMLWTLRLGRRQNNTTNSDIQLNELRVYNKYMSAQELAQNTFFIKDSVNRRMKPIVLS